MTTRISRCMLYFGRMKGNHILRNKEIPRKWLKRLSLISSILFPFERFVVTRAQSSIVCSDTYTREPYRRLLVILFVVINLPSFRLRKHRLLTWFETLEPRASASVRVS